MLAAGLSKSQSALNEIKERFTGHKKARKDLGKSYPSSSNTSLEADQSVFDEPFDLNENSFMKHFKRRPGNLKAHAKNERRSPPVHREAEKEDARKRSSVGSATTYSPIIAKKDLASHPFSIPPTYSQMHSLSRSHGSVDLCHLDLAQYHEKSDEQEERKIRRSTGIPLAEIDVVLRYIHSEELLAVTVHSVSKFLLPSPSVIGNRWNITPKVTMSLLPDKKRFFEAKHQLEIKDDTTAFISVKSSDVETKTLRLTVYDSRRRNTHLAIGHALIPLRDVDSAGRVTTFTRPLTCYSEPAGFNKGKMELSLTWVVSAEKLEIKVTRAYNIKSPRGVLGRDFFVKLFAYIGDQETKTFKTAAAKATPDVEFGEKFIISISSENLRNSTFLFCLYAKHLIKLTLTSEFIGSTVIGPYMSNRSRAMSQWEKTITCPFDEVTERHTIYI